MVDRPNNIPPGLRLQIADPFAPLIMAYLEWCETRVSFKESLKAERGMRLHEINKAINKNSVAEKWDPETCYFGLTEAVLRIVEATYDDPIWGVRDMMRRMIASDGNTITELHIVIMVAAAADILEGRTSNQDIVPLDTTMERMIDIPSDLPPVEYK